MPNLQNPHSSKLIYPQPQLLTFIGITFHPSLNAPPTILLEIGFAIIYYDHILHIISHPDSGPVKKTLKNTLTSKWPNPLQRQYLYNSKKIFPENLLDNTFTILHISFT